MFFELIAEAMNEVEILCSNAFTIAAGICSVFLLLCIFGVLLYIIVEYIKESYYIRNACKLCAYKDTCPDCKLKYKE